MSSTPELEEVMNSTMENLSPEFLVFGKKKEHNPLEDFWMCKLESIEKQYDDHIIKLEKTLLDNRATKRRLTQKEEHIVKLKGDVKEKDEKLQKLGQQASQLDTNLSFQTYKSTMLNTRLSKTETLKSKILTSLQNERFERMKCERELTSLKHRLIHLERDKKFLLSEVCLKDNERKRVEEREAQLARNKLNLIKNLTHIDQERRTQTGANVKLVEEVGRLLHGCKTQEYTLLKQRAEIDLMLESMRQKRRENEEALRKLGISRNELGNAEIENKVSKEKIEHLERQVRHWREEFQFQESGNRSVGLDIKDLHRENGQLRCKLAELREKLNLNGIRMKSLEIEKRRTEINLHNAQGQAKSVHLVMCRNELVKQKLANKILKTYPSVQQALDKKTRNGKGTQESVSRGREKRKEIESYKKAIWQLERQKRELEMEIKESNERRNRLQYKLKRYDGMEQQILWTEKAMAKLEGDRNRIQDLMSTMSLSAPIKLPFEKLVTDPSIMDRMAKYQVLQKRLLQQSEKVEKLKRNTVKIMEFRKLQYEDEIADKRHQLPQWKLSHWKYSSEDTLVDVDHQMLEPEGKMPLQERKYYKDYLTHIDNEIPQIKKEIAVLERKQQYRQQQLLDAETKSKNQAEVGRMRQESVEAEALIAKLGSGDESLEIPEDEDEIVQDDSDVDGLLAVVSIDEPSSARRSDSRAEDDNLETDNQINQIGADEENGENGDATEDARDINDDESDQDTDNEQDNQNESAVQE